jgi:hypothetical protein
MRTLPDFIRFLASDSRTARLPLLSTVAVAFLLALPDAAMSAEPEDRPGLLSALGRRRAQAGAAQGEVAPSQPQGTLSGQPVCQEESSGERKQLPEAQGQSKSTFGKDSSSIPKPEETSDQPNDGADDEEDGEGEGEMAAGGFGLGPKRSLSRPRPVGVAAGPSEWSVRTSKPPGKESAVEGSSYESPPRPSETDLRSFARELDAIEKEINEWGHSSMSGLVMFPMSSRFHINNRQTIDDYIRETKAHSAGGASLSSSTALVAAASAGISTKELGVAAGDVPVTVEAPSNLTVNIESHDITPTAETDPKPKTVTQNPETSGHAGFQTTATLSPEQVDTIAGSAFVNKEVMNLFSFPAGASDQFVMFFGLAQVNVSPGWRTKKDYYCEVQMRPVYAGFDGERYYRSYEVGEYEQPMVFSAFPLLKAQVLDLQHHEEQQADIILSFAGAAAAAGNSQSAKALLNYHKKLTQDVKTRTALPLLVPSSDGTQLTYRFDPGLQAVEDPSSIRSKPENVLNATSVPTLFVVVCEREELARWTHINILVNTRFAPLDRRHLMVQAVYDLPRFTYFKGIRRSNLQRLKTAQSYTHLADYINTLYDYSFEETPLVDELRNRFLNLRTLAGGVNTFLELPQAESFIAITNVYPNSLTVDQVIGTQLSIEGEFGRPGNEAPTVLVAGRPVDVHTYGKNGIILNPLTERLASGNHPVVVTNSAGLHIFSGGLTVRPK